MGVIAAAVLISAGASLVAAGVFVLAGLGAALVVAGVEVAAAGLVVDFDVVRWSRDRG